MDRARKTTFSVADTTGSPTKRASAGARLAGEPLSNAAATPACFSATRFKGERVKVFVRVRPTRPDETPGALHLRSDGASLAALKRDDGGATDFSFDQVLPPAASQADCYDAAVKPVVADVLRGYNATLLAYGMTGSGKTYTLGSIRPDAVGMIPRAAAEVFAAITADPGHQYSVQLAYLQVYCEQIQDLLCPESGDSLAIREGEGGVWVPGLRQVAVASLDDCLRLLQLGDRNRSVAFTALNAHSSRSHAVVMLTVEKRGGIGDAAGGSAGAAAQRVRVGKLFMVDLAGSERLKKSRSTGQRASEAKAINLSLTTLGMCVNARADPAATHVPFRDSKLTRLLQESLGGNAKTSLVVAVSDAREHCEETLQSLAFGSRAMRVATQARVNERVDVPGGGGGVGGPETAALLAALHGADGRSSALERSLMEREGALEEARAQLKAEREQCSQVVRALQQEREGALAREQALAEQHAARMQQQERHTTTLQERLEAAEVQAAEMARRHARDTAELQAALDAHRRAADEARAAAGLQAQRHVQERQQLHQQWRGERDELARRHAAEAAAAASCHAAELEAARLEASGAARRLEESESEVRALHAEYGRALSAASDEWAERLRRAADAAQRAQQEALASAAAQHGAELRAAQQHARGFEEQLAAAQAAVCTAADEHAAALRAAQSDWDGRMLQAAEAAQRAQQDALAAAAARHAAEVHDLQQRANELEQQLAAAQAAVRAAADEHAAALRSAQSDWDGRMLQAAEAGHRAQRDALAVAAARHAAEVHALQQQTSATEQKAASAEARQRAAAAGHAAALHAAKAEWAERVREAERTTACFQEQATAELAARDKEIAELQVAVQQRDVKVAQAKDAAQQLEAALLQMRAAVGTLQGRLAAAERTAAAEEERAERAAAEAEQQRAARLAVGASMLQRRRVSAAARTIQRAYRAYRLRQLDRQRAEGHAALHEAQHALGSLAEQHAELERRRRASLAFAGQTLVADSVGLLQQAVDELVSTFLLPAKDIKTLQRFRQKTGGAGAPAAPSVGADGVLFAPAELPTRSGAGGDASGGDLIRAFNPAAAAALVRSSAPFSAATAAPKALSRSERAW